MHSIKICVAKRHCVSYYHRSGAIKTASWAQRRVNRRRERSRRDPGARRSQFARAFKWMARPSDRQRMARPYRPPLPLRARLCRRRGRASAARATRSSRRPRPTGGRAAPGCAEPQTQRLWRGSSRERNAARSSRGQEHTYPTYNIQGQPQQGAGAMCGGANKAALWTGGRRLLVRL